MKAKIFLSAVGLLGMMASPALACRGSWPPPPVELEGAYDQYALGASVVLLGTLVETNARGRHVRVDQVLLGDYPGPEIEVVEGANICFHPGVPGLPEDARFGDRFIVMTNGRQDIELFEYELVVSVSDERAERLLALKSLSAALVK